MLVVFFSFILTINLLTVIYALYYLLYYIYSFYIYFKSLLLFFILLSSFLYVIVLLFFSIIFSINLNGKIDSITNDNFECGFYSIITSLLRYRFNYYLILIHFILFEQELFLLLLLINSL